MSNLSLRSRILLLALLPLLGALLIIALAVRHQEQSLTEREHALVERVYMEARRAELSNYVALATSTVAPLYGKTHPEPGDREQALKALGALDYGSDGYFFVYDLQGTVLMHSRQPELIGRNLWELRAPDGRYTIQRLIQRARAGGGFVDYLWRKPSSGQMVTKLGYVIALERWNLMLGTGLYLDDIEGTLKTLEAEARLHRATTMLWITGIAVFGVVLTAGAGLALNLSEQRVTESKLRLLARQVQQSQESERAHLARELHDGISQTLVSTKLMVEAAAERVASTPAAAAAAEPLTKALERLNSTLTETRRISHRLRPALLDTLGLSAALQHLGQQVEDAGGPAVPVRIEGSERELSGEIKTALFRVAQESLTNAVKHARAQQVDVTLTFEDDCGVRMTIADDGRGFDLAAVRDDPEQGIGLRNMRERLDAIGGRLDVRSEPGEGTRIEAWLLRG